MQLPEFRNNKNYIKIKTDILKSVDFCRIPFSIVYRGTTHAWRVRYGNTVRVLVGRASATHWMAAPRPASFDRRLSLQMTILKHYQLKLNLMLQLFTPQPSISNLVGLYLWSFSQGCGTCIIVKFVCTLFCLEFSSGEEDFYLEFMAALV